jgi:hypothetical protein
MCQLVKTETSYLNILVRKHNTAIEIASALTNLFKTILGPRGFRSQNFHLPPKAR